MAFLLHRATLISKTQSHKKISSTNIRYSRSSFSISINYLYPSSSTLGLMGPPSSCIAIAIPCTLSLMPSIDCVFFYMYNIIRCYTNLFKDL